MARYVNRETRVVLYGTITYEDGIAKRIQVEDFTAIAADDALPTLEDLHSLRLRTPGGMGVEEFLDDVRGDD
jgi:seryl-tRNA(Sec) selenium transferase